MRRPLLFPLVLLLVGAAAFPQAPLQRNCSAEAIPAVCESAECPGFRWCDLCDACLPVEAAVPKEDL